MKDSPENRKLMKETNAEVKKKLVSQKKESGKKRKNQVKAEKNVSAKKRKSKEDTESESDEEIPSKKRNPVRKSMDQMFEDPLSNQRALFDVLKAPVPENLTQLLLMDYELFGEQRKRLVLPRSPSVVEILEKFVSRIGKDNEGAKANVAVFAEGIQRYFDQVLGSRLLLECEMEQYEGVRQIAKDVPSRIYGAEHLLRLLSSLRVISVSDCSSQAALVSFIVSDLRLNDSNP